MRKVTALSAAGSLSGCALPLLMAPSLGVAAGSGAYINGSVKHAQREIDASEDAARPAWTAAAIGHSTDPGSIRIADVQREKYLTRWTAEAPDGVYSCTNGKQATVYCVKKAK